MRRRAVIVALALLLALALVLLLRPRQEPPRGAATRLAARDQRSLPRPGVASSAGPDDEAGYRIDEIRLDRTRICANQDVQVHVRAQDPVGHDEWLVPVISLPGVNVRGFDSVIRPGGITTLPQTRDALDGQLTVQLVDRRKMKIVATRKVPLVIERCAAPDGGLVVNCRWRQTKDGDAQCRADVAPDSSFVPVRYEWSVVDAELHDEPLASSTRPAALLTLPARAQDRVLTTQVVRARAFDAQGASIEGRASLERPNTRWQTAQEGGLLELATEFDSHPVRQGDQYVTEVDLVNPFAEAVDLEEVVVSTVACGDKQKVPQPPVKASTLFAADRLEPLGRLRTTWKLPVDAGRCLARADLTGRGVTSGLPAQAAWVMPTDPSQKASMSEAEGAWLRQALAAQRQRTGKPATRLTRKDVEELVLSGAIPPPPPSEP